MKRFLSILIVMLLFLGACTPIGTATSPVEVLKTSIALTQTANPTKTPGQPLIATATGLPSPTPTVLASPTATVTVAVPLPLFSPVPVIPPAGVSQSPAYADQFIYYYFQHINNRDYGTTWSLLTESFKAAVNGPETGGYNGYVNYWNTVQRVDVLSVYINSYNGYYADVSVRMVYNYFNGVVSETLVPFYLYYDSVRGTWMFHTYATVPATPVPVTSYTPDQFIYHYFYHINMRNYTYTWSLLSDSFINNNNSPAQGGYDGYVSYWNTVARVDVNYVTIISQTGDYADVTAGLTFNKTDGTVTSLSLSYYLVYNYTIHNWQFYSP